MCQILPRLRESLSRIRQRRLNFSTAVVMKHNRPLPGLDDFEAYRPTSRPLAAARAPAIKARVQLTPRQTLLDWIGRLLAAGIMLETLFFKFTGAPESVYIFSQMNLEPWWRYGQGVWELLAAVLLLLPRTAWAGGVLTLGAIGAALVSHLTVLGIEIQGDGGMLFGMAWAAFLGGAVVTFLHRREIPGYVSLSS